LCVATRGGSIVGNTRKEIEANIGKSIVLPLNAKSKELAENYEK